MGRGGRVSPASSRAYVRNGIEVGCIFFEFSVQGEIGYGVVSLILCLVCIIVHILCVFYGGKGAVKPLYMRRLMCPRSGLKKKRHCLNLLVSKARLLRMHIS